LLELPYDHRGGLGLDGLLFAAVTVGGDGGSERAQKLRPVLGEYGCGTLPRDVIFRLLLGELRGAGPDLGCHTDGEHFAFEPFFHALHDLDAVRVEIAPGSDIPGIDVPEERD
jgi:hypothetical protein